MKRIAFFTVLFFVFSAIIYGQGVVKGKLSDESGLPMVGVSVAVEGTYVGTISDNTGEYELSLKKEGDYSLAFSFMGYKKRVVPVKMTGSTVTVDMKMEPSVIMANEVIVSAIRAQKKTPVTYAEMKEKDIKEVNYGEDMPYIINQMPGVVVTSDAGAGVGYSAFRIRGADISRINVTVNGIPLNDSESQGVFFVNMPDFAASVEKIQVQRGVGTSTNGTASFGASVNFSTLNEKPTASSLIDNSYGSFNTWKNSVSLSTGLLPGNFAFDARLSRISSDGFIDRATSNMKSYYLTGGYYGEKFSIKFITFSGEEKTYQAWSGVPKVKLEGDVEGMERLVMMDGWSDEEAANLYSSNARTFNKYLYKNQTDNYGQSHYQLHHSHTISNNFNVNAALHYTKGKGYYESYKYNRKFGDYNFGFDQINVNGEVVTKTNLIQQKWLDNDFYGVTFSGNYFFNRAQITIGGAYNNYDGDHYGEVIWTEVNNGISPDFEWYRNNGKKSDFNTFVKALYSISDNVSLFGDVQYRNVNVDMNGLHDDLSDLTQSYIFDFVNPKGGLTWNIAEQHRVFASFAMAKREPTRSDFRDAPDNRKPTEEKLYDYELGYSWRTNRLSVDANLFFMDYTDQLVLTGEINNVGSAIMVNVPESYRQGIELSGAFVLRSNINWSLNASFSSNKINDFTQYVDNWSYWVDPDNEPYQVVSHLGRTDIAFSPEVTAASRFAWKPVRGLTLSLLSKYVGKQYIDNSSSEERKLNPWFVNDIMVGYGFTIKKVGSFDLGMKVNNIFNKEYESNAWVYQYYYKGDHDVLDGYFPQAGTNVMFRLAMRF